MTRWHAEEPHSDVGGPSATAVPGASGLSGTIGAGAAQPPVVAVPEQVTLLERARPTPPPERSAA